MQYLKELARQGFLVEPSIADRLDNISASDFNNLVSQLKKDNIFVLDAKNFYRFFKPDVNVLKTFQETKKFSMQEYVNTLNRRYEFIQSILVDKVELTNLLSINKIGLGKVSVIGFVKEKEERDNNFVLTIEDQTGEIKTVVSKDIADKANLDDVVAMTGNINNKIFFAEKLLFPDIPLREPRLSDASVKIAFTEGQTEADYIITKNDVKDVASNKTLKYSGPVLLEIAGIIVLVILDEDPLGILRKRYMRKQNSDFLIDPIPDIVFNNVGVKSNYKGVSILPENVLVDLSTREIIQI